MRLVAQGSWACPSCGASRQIAADHLRQSDERLRRLREAMQAAEAPLVALQEGTLRRHVMPYAVAVLFMLVQAASGIGSMISSLVTAGAAVTAATRGEILRTGLGMSGLGLGIVVGSTFGYMRAWRTLRGHLELFRSARPPLTPGSPARCRCCGAALPGAWGGVSTCGYCRTENLLDPKLVHEREAGLSDETAELHGRAARSMAAMKAFAPKFTLYWTVGAGVGGATLALLGMIVAVLVSALCFPPDAPLT